jgi:hypothetical protein
MMTGFVKNLDKQVDRVGEVADDLVSRVGTRILNVPYRKWKTEFAGSGEEKVLEAYLTEISNEIGKLSTGSTASVAELSQSAQEKWAKIHDPNLSISDLKTILEETKHMGRLRLDSSTEARDFTEERLKSIGKSKTDDGDKPQEKKESKTEPKPDPAIAARVAELKGKYPDSKIAQDLKEKGLNPRLYGLE